MTRRIELVLLDDFADWEGAALAAAARAWLGAEIGYRTPGGTAVRSMGGACLQPTGAIETLDPGALDALVLIGSSRWEDAAAPDLGGPLREAERRGLVIGAICGGTLALARAGLLDARAHTSNALDYLASHAPAYQGASAYRDIPTAATAGRIVTAPGSAPATFAAALLGLLWPGDPLPGYLLALMGREHAAPASASSPP
ncbi:DJ-1/PfpI family protein [Salinarimonas soli]|uniref:DJ-1/PfpI family protein n=1 Tax=Salinarimonas soli TaxID=1638099 RepID=UPI0016620C33|nr:DJ-1/PfpI family protein [Salinarimonas soli]